jgi:hypothetical protein
MAVIMQSGRKREMEDGRKNARKAERIDEKEIWK